VLIPQIETVDLTQLGKEFANRLMEELLPLVE
jgi:hypothetical protein